MTTGTMHSGSVACMHSSIRIEVTLSLANLGSPAPDQAKDCQYQMFLVLPSKLTNASAADHIGYVQKLSFSLFSQRSEAFLIGGRQLPSLLFEHLQLVQFPRTVNIQAKIQVPCPLVCLRFVYLSMFLIWLCNDKWPTGESIASLDLAHSRTTCDNGKKRKQSGMEM